MLYQADAAASMYLLNAGAAPVRPRIAKSDKNKKELYR